MGSKANIAAIVALDTTNLEDGIAYWAIAEQQWIGLDKASTATANNQSCWTATGGGRWLLSSSGTVIASTMPTGGAATGTRWIYQENDAANTYDSVITYYYNGATWVELDSRMRLHADTPDSISATPNSDSENWKDTSTGVIYTAFSGGWIQVGSGGVS